MRPPFSPPGRECVAPGGREAPGEPFRWGSPGPLRDDTKRGDPRVPPLWKHPPWGTGAGNPPATAKRPCPPPFCERGASPATTWLSVGRCPAIPNSQGAAAKREAESIRKCPQLFHAPYVVEWVTPAGFHWATPPYQALRAFRAKPGMPPPEPFSLTPSKGAFSFSSERGTPQKPSEAGFVGKRRGNGAV